MGISDSSGSQRFPVSADVAWEHLKRVAPRLGTVQDTDDLLKRMNLGTGMSALTWGENLTVSIEPETAESCVVSVSSAAKAGGVIGVAGHMAAGSRNSKHVNDVISAISASIQGRGETVPHTGGGGCLVLLAALGIGASALVASLLVALPG